MTLEEQWAEMAQRQDREKLESYRQLNRLAKKGQVVFTGSSLMEQFPLNEMLQGEALPYLVYNRGMSGFVAPQLLQVLDVCVYELAPAHVFLNIGTNDMSRPDYRQEALLACYRRILEEILSHVPGVKLHLLAYYPVNPDLEGQEGWAAEALRYRTNQVLREANRGVEALAREMGAEYLDLNAPLLDGQGRLRAQYTKEGIHLYPAGYQAVLGELLPVLRSLS